MGRKQNDAIIEKYSDAAEIWVLQRKKAKNKKESLLDAAVCFFTPLVEITETADAIADLGFYYLVAMPDRQLLVRYEKGDIAEKDITGLGYDKKFTVDQNRFIKVLKIYG
ncbi:MAG: hypothetical protein J6L81_09860 [Clostridia bacterium]|nr:hypothetical protein [Clostridia bacterium]